MNPTIEIIARALCKKAGHPENIRFQGKPMWENYRSQARAVFSALKEEGILGDNERVFAERAPRYAAATYQPSAQWNDGVTR